MGEEDSNGDSGSGDEVEFAISLRRLLDRGVEGTEALRRLLGWGVEGTVEVLRRLLSCRRGVEGTTEALLCLLSCSAGDDAIENTIPLAY